MIDLRRLRSFVVVAEELHFGRAAQRLHIAQPPLSQQIRLLERDLGAQLFNRNRRKVELTAAGRLLLAHARPLLEQAERVESLVALAGAGKAGFLAIGFVASAAYEAMPAAVRAFRERQPEVELRLRRATPPSCWPTSTPAASTSRSCAGRWSTAARGRRAGGRAAGRSPAGRPPRRRCVGAAASARWPARAS